MSTNDLGAFLRAHRARLRPGDVGLASYGARRVAGLRREEVAVLAGMNSDYYARLEQGRERSPSPQILEAISSALRMDDDAREHMFRLAGTLPAGERPRPRETVSPVLRQLLDGYPNAPAFVLNPATDVLASNAVAGALFSPFEKVDNLARMTFLDPAARTFFRQWDRAAEAVVAELRHATGLDPHYRRVHDLAGSLAGVSEEFAALWSSHTVHRKTREGKELLHPDVGALALTFQTLDVRGAPGQQLVIYQAEPGSPSAQALTLLGSLHATHRQESATDR
ncbi:helix-turn-helix transcriptional regulator [Streptomyces sp. ACA25]|uniref:helix-turn-helix transcriptional regulator n=1 Tax=Streptomyces sp. ACA25 TaxID=3022596 RepID=UPI0023083349|nr:helix-turn-helix transcriptional regulator [Streptomyces sp. ACA25]MDB1088695.1 helix-turn-helix transcriptional regulator [Streptomyces sp. ACA25]